MEFYGTLGGLCRDRALLVRLFRAGMTGARLNLSHTSLSQCSALLEEHFFPAARQAGVDFRFYAYNKDKPLGARCAPPKM